MNNLENNFNQELELQQPEVAEEQFNETISALKEKRDQEASARAENREQMTLNEYIDSKLNDYPSELKDKFLGSLKKYKEESLASGLRDEQLDGQLKIVVDVFSSYVKEGYLSKMTDLPNKSFVTADMISTIDNIFKEGVPAKEDFQKISYIMFDLNGLKAINDLNASHKQGDEFLKLAARALQSAELQAVADKHKMTMSICHESGDEFSIKVLSQGPASDKQLQELTETAQDILLNMEEASSLVDLKDKNVAYRLYEIEANAQGDKADSMDSDEFDKFFKALPKDFEFRAYMSAGFSTLYNAIVFTKENSKNFLQAGDSYEVGIGKAAGAIFDISNEAMDINKKQMKEKIRESNNPRDMMIARLWDIREGGKQLKESLLKSREQEKILKQKVEDAEEQIRALKQKIEDATKMLEQDANSESILEKLAA